MLSTAASVDKTACCQTERWACAGTLPWWSGDVVYQIYPRSFADSTGDGIGDVRGILQHMDYLTALNITAVWLSPVFPSPMVDGGYDVSNYTNVDPIFGTLADLDALIAALHARGIRVLLDLVPNHTSNQHPWFVSASSSRSSPYRNFYVWAEPSVSNSSVDFPGPLPNNWLSFFGGSAWTWEPRTRQWYLHQYLPQQPDLNWRNPRVLVAFGDIVRFWMARGVDGFRVDSLPTLLEDAQLRNEPRNPDWRPGQDPFLSQLHLNVTQDVPPLQQLVHRLRDFADEGHSVLVCETPLPPKELSDFYFGCQLPFFFGLVHWTAAWNASRLRHEIVSYLQEVPTGGATPTFVLSNHDNPRVASRLGGKRQARAALLLLLTLPGTPTVYQGEELGLRDAVVRPDQVRDTSALRQPRSLWATVGRDPERAPMPWSAQPPDGGFSSVPGSAPPWLPLPPDWNTTVNVAVQTGDPLSTLSLFKRLTALRREQPALRGSPFVPLDVGLENDNVLAFARPLLCDCGDSSAPSPAPEVQYPPDVYERPANGDSAFIILFNLGNAAAHINVTQSLISAGLASLPDGHKLTVVIDSVDVVARAGESIDAMDVAVQSWQAVVFTLPLAW